MHELRGMTDYKGDLGYQKRKVNGERLKKKYDTIIDVLNLNILYN